MSKYLAVEDLVQGIVEAFQETNVFFQDKTIQDIDQCSTFPLIELWQGDNQEEFGCDTSACVEHNLKIRAWDQFPPGCADSVKQVRKAAVTEININKDRIRTIFKTLLNQYGFNTLNSPQNKIRWKIVKRGKTERCLYGVEGALKLERIERPSCCSTVEDRLLPECGKIEKSNWNIA